MSWVWGRFTCACVPCIGLHSAHFKYGTVVFATYTSLKLFLKLSKSANRMTHPLHQKESTAPAPIASFCFCPHLLSGL